MLTMGVDLARILTDARADTEGLVGARGGSTVGWVWGKGFAPSPKKSFFSPEMTYFGEF